MVEQGSEGPGNEPPDGSSPFSPAPAVEFSPDVEHPDLGSAPVTPPMTPGEHEEPPPVSKPLFEQAGFAPGGFTADEAGAEGGFAANGRAAAGSFAARDGAGGAGAPAGGVGGSAFSTAEVHQDSPLWSTRPNEPGELRTGARENGWMVVTAVLVAIFVAVTVGYTVLSDPSPSSQARVEEAPLTRPDLVESLAPVPDPTDSVPTTSVVTTTTVAAVTPTTSPVGEWAPIIAEDRSFRAEMPGTPTIVSANLSGSPAVSYSVDSGDSTFRILTSDFVAATEAEIDVGLEAEAAASVDGAAVTGGPVTAYPGGVRVYDFTATRGNATVMGRALAANGHRYVLTMTVPTIQVDSPAALADLVRFRNGFLSTP